MYKKMTDQYMNQLDILANICFADIAGNDTFGNVQNLILLAVM